MKGRKRNKLKKEMREIKMINYVNMEKVEKKKVQKIRNGQRRINHMEKQKTKKSGLQVGVWETENQVKII